MIGDTLPEAKIRQALALLRVNDLTAAGEDELITSMKRIWDTKKNSFGTEFLTSMWNTAQSTEAVALALASAWALPCYPQVHANATLGLDPMTPAGPELALKLERVIVTEKMAIFRIVSDADPRFEGMHIAYVTSPLPNGPMAEALRACANEHRTLKVRYYGIISRSALGGLRESASQRTAEAMSGGDDGDGNALDRKIRAIIDDAAKNQVSDIHIQPVEGRVRLRYYMRGANVEVGTIEKDQYLPFANRLMSMAKGEGGGYQKIYDNVISHNIVDEKGKLIRTIQIRLNMMPTRVVGWDENAPKFTLRLLGNTAEKLTLKQLALPNTEQNRQQDALLRLSNRKYGLFLNTGPTGSGKTSTLNAVLETVKAAHPEYQIYTLEDPVEMPSYGVSHVQVNEAAEMTWAAGLKAFMRGAPHICVVGEIRTVEVANLAIELSLTGHFVMSTLHTNSAPSTITRLVNMGIDPYVLGDALAGVMAQRLVKKVCAECSVTLKWSDAMSGNHPLLQEEDRQLSRMQFGALESNYRDLKAYPKDLSKLIRIKGPDDKVKACKACKGQGTLARPAMVSEVLTITPDIALMIHDRRSAVDIQRAATAQGYREIWEHAMSLVAQQIITFDDAVDKLSERQPLMESTPPAGRHPPEHHPRAQAVPHAREDSERGDHLPLVAQHQMGTQVRAGAAA